MKKTSIFILFVLICNCSPLLGQSNYAPLGAFWNYSYVGHSGSPRSNWTIQVTHDTIVNGTAIKSLTLFEDIYNSWYPPPYVGIYSYPFGEIHYRNDSVFSSDSNTEEFKYRFTMNVGDSIVIIPGSVYTAVVDSMSFVVINGDTLKKWFLTKHCNTSYQEQATIIENIGPIDDYLFWQVDGCQIGGGSYYFECYKSSVLDYNLPCTPITLSIDDIDNLNNRLSIFPIPVQDFLSLSLEHSVNECRVKILDITMKTVYDHLFSVLSSSIIDISALSVGNYWITLESEKYNTARRISKVK